MDINKWILEQEAKIRQEELDFKLAKIKYESFQNNLNTTMQLLCTQNTLSVMSLFHSAIRGVD